MHKINHANIKDWAKNYDGPLFDGILCDPPYHLVSGKTSEEIGHPSWNSKTKSSRTAKKKGFMGKDWDGVDENGIGIAQDPEMWRLLYNLLKPGAHLLAFSGSRTYHRMAVAIEDAGFEPRDMLVYCYGSGFPKSLNIGKAVDRIQGNEREDLGISDNNRDRSKHEYNSVGNVGSNARVTKGKSEWEGYGTALKPAIEPIILARKPISEKNIALNVLKHGTGGLAIDNCRIKPANATDEPSNPLLSAQRTVFSDKPELAPSSLDEIFSYSLGTLHDYFEHISSEQRAYNTVCTTPLRDVAFLKNTQSKQLLGVPCDYGQLVEHVKQYESQGYEVGDFLSDYPTLHRLCDVYARQAKVPDQDVAPLLADVLSYIRSVQQESLHSPDCSSQYLLLVLVVFAYDLLRSILPYDYTTSSTQSTGRFPSNLILDGSDEVEAVFPQTGSGKFSKQTRQRKGFMLSGSEDNVQEANAPDNYGDSGSASRYFYCAKASKSERNAGLDSTVSIVVQLEQCEKNITSSVKLAQLQVVMDNSHLKATAESGIGTKSGTEWSMSWFGNQYTEKYPINTKSTTKTTTSSTTTSVILNWLIGLLTNESTLGVSLEMASGGNPVKSAESSNTLIATINDQTALALGVNPAQANKRLLISVSDGKNFHSTVKPLSLTKYLATLIKPPTGGRLLVPFSGSGSEMIGALQAGWEYVEGVELTEEYIPIAEARIKYWLEQMGKEQISLL